MNRNTSVSNNEANGKDLSFILTTLNQSSPTDNQLKNLMKMLKQLRNMNQKRYVQFCSDISGVKAQYENGNYNETLRPTTFKAYLKDALKEIGYEDPALDKDMELIFETFGANTNFKTLGNITKKLEQLRFNSSTKYNRFHSDMTQLKIDYKKDGYNQNITAHTFQSYLNDALKQSGGGKKSTSIKDKKIRKHKGIYQSGPKKGNLKPGYKYSGQKTNTGLKIIVKMKNS